MALIDVLRNEPNRVRGVLGKYQLVASLGQGGMAKVYLALVAGPLGVNKLMVVKILRTEVIQGLEGGIELFWDEARLAARLQHPNIVHTYEVGEIDGHYFLAMEYLEGQIYRALQARTAQARMPLYEELRILCEVARGLHYAHELSDYQGKPLGVVHRDVSPQNVFVTYDGQVKLIDFGIAKTRDAAHETRVGLIKGKLNYIAPEQLRGDPLDRRADIFALGVMLWEAIAGRRFAGGPQVAEVTKVHARIKGEEPNIRSVKPDVPEELARLVDRSIALDREQRWNDSAALAEALETYMESAGMRPSSKGLSLRMHALFEQDRATMQKVVDARLQALVHGGGEEAIYDLPVLPSFEDLHTGSGSLAARNAALRTSSTAVPSWSGTQRRAAASVWRKFGVAAAGAGATLVVAAGFAAFSGRDEPRSQTAPNASALAPHLIPSQASTAEAKGLPSAAPAAAEIRVNVKLTVSPTSALVSIDGATVPIPFTGAFLKSDTLHRLEIHAPGYLPVVRLLPFNQDHALSVALEPENANRRPSGTRMRATERPTAPIAAQATEPLRSSAPSEEPAKPSTVVPGADIESRRQRVGQGPIDTSDPYSN